MKALVKIYRIAQVQKQRRKHKEELLAAKVEDTIAKSKALVIKMEKYNTKINLIKI